MMKTKFLILIFMFLVVYLSGGNARQIYKMCVPRQFYEDCLDLLDNNISIECVAGRDRVDCLQLIENNEADVVALEPEDVYLIPHNMKNNNFRVIAEFRFNWQMNDEYEDEDVILIRKTSSIKSFKDFKGLKSCHPGFNSQFGYKVIIAKLKEDAIMNDFYDENIPFLEKELKGISEVFWHSCIPGDYSYDQKYDQELKTKYPNLCKICNNPNDCSYNDKYASYDGAIECLHNGYGDIAFTRMSAVKKFFGAQDIDFQNGVANINDYKYFCEDGSRAPINGSGCSLYKRPYRSYITNVNIANDSELLDNLQTSLSKFFKNGLENLHPQAAKNLLIENGMELYEKYQNNITPDKYISQFNYFVELADFYTTKMKFCVSTKIELEKCQILSALALANNIRPKMYCFQPDDNNCFTSIVTFSNDIGIAPFYKWKIMNYDFNEYLEPILYENLVFDDVFIAIFDSSLTLEDVEKLPIKFNNSDKNAKRAACALNIILTHSNCDDLDAKNDVENESYIHVIKSKDRHNYGTNKSLLCLNKTRERLGRYLTCHLEKYFQNVVFVNKDARPDIIEIYRNVLIGLGNTFGRGGLYSNVFDIFSPFKGHNNVIFNDNTYNLHEYGIEPFYEFPHELYDLFNEIENI